MEEKDIKELWKQGDELDSGSYSQSTIERIMISKPKDIVSKFINTLKIEQWLNLVSLGVLSIFLLYSQFWIEGSVILVLNILMFLYYKRIIQQISKESIDIDVAQYLCNVYESIKRFILHYKILLWIITLPAYIYGVYFHDPKKFHDMDGNMTFKYALLLIAGLVIAMILAHAILYFMYGKKAKKIKQMVKLLKQEESD